MRISPDPEKIKAIKDMPSPKSKQDLWRFLEMIAYLSKFIPQLSEQTYELRKLVKKNSIWDFPITSRNQFDKLRSMFNENISLKFFDLKLPKKLLVTRPNLELMQLSNKNMRTIGILQLSNMINLCWTKLLSLRKREISCFCLLKIQWIPVWQKIYHRKWS